jgi:hypothetical protein
MALIYFELRTVDLCSEWDAKNYTLSFDIERIKLIGEGFQTVILYLSVPSFFIILFGWTEFKRHYSSTILVGQLAGLFNTLFLSFLLLYGIDDTSPIETYNVPGNLIYAVRRYSLGICNCCAQYSKKSTNCILLRSPYFLGSCSTGIEHLSNGIVLQIRGC